MANLYVRSTDGNDVDDGSTWALAKATLAGAASIDAAGDRIYVSQSHSESTAAAITAAFAGTVASPVWVVCGNDAAEPPTAVAATGQVATTGANAISLTGHAYVYGLIFSAGDAANSASININTTPGNLSQRLESCALRITNTSSSSRINLGPSTTVSSTTTELLNTTMKFGATGQFITLGGNVHINGGSLEAGTSAITTFCAAASSQRATRALIENFDLSNAATGVNLVTGGGSMGMATYICFRDCKLPASWSGLLLSAAATNPGVRVEMYNCAAGDTNYALWLEDMYGSVRHETTIVRSGGASDGTTSLSWKMTTTADAEYPMNVLRSGEFGDWNDTTGSSKTLTVEILHDSVTALTDAEVWLEVSYLGTSGTPLGVHISDAKADVLAAATGQTASSETWTTTGLTNPNKQKLSVTFTPQEKGFYVCKVCLAKPGPYTVYVDPKVTVS